jgi:phenylacetate-CoA ligase
LARLQAIVRHADATVPFYRERFAAAGFAPGDLKSLADLKKLPLLAKADIRERGQDMRSTAADLGPLMPRKTSGSTGVSLNFFNDDACAQWKRGVELYRNRWTGWRLGEYRAMVWGNPPAMDFGRLQRPAGARFLSDTLRTTR